MEKRVEDLLESFKWRYAAKRMTGKKFEKTIIETIVEAARLAPTSLGMQPFELLVIEDQATKEKLKPACYNQPQTTESSHLLIFAVWEEVTPQKIEAYVSNVAETRGIPVQTLDPLKQSIARSLIGKPNEQNQIWAKNQTYIALGFAMAAAATQRVDSTPMEGFNPAAVDTTLGLKEVGLKSSVILAIGERDMTNDFLTGQAKVRRSASQFVRWI